MPASSPASPAIPTSVDAARAILPGVRIAARERYGRVRMAFLAPFLMILIQIAGEFLLKFLQEWLSKREESASASMTLLAMDWGDHAMPEVKTAMAKVAAGETGE